MRSLFSFILAFLYEHTFALLRGREYWEKRADALPRDTGWFVGRTDMLSFSAVDGGYVHYAYPPDDPNGNKPRIPFRGSPTSALRKAVKFAEHANEERLCL